ncbi:MAG: hypothetical protein EA367_19925 [Leptolyngbya sp. DLM2.Bin15]|nr:MAG: hypothetical protein EA367_19925 [Leptolyngbya sp. DLM2.Bin15]
MLMIEGLAVASPFQTWAEFEGAMDGPTGGAIYTFADRPGINAIMLIVSALMFIYFLYASFHTKINDEPAKSPTALGVLFLAGAVSLASAAYDAYANRQPQEAFQRRSTPEAIARQRSGSPVLFGLMGMTAGLPKAFQTRSKRRRKPSRDRYSRF